MRYKTVSVRCKDAIAGSLLFAATAAVVVLQNSRQGVLWDLSFMLEDAYRISLGWVPRAPALLTCDAVTCDDGLG